MCDVLSHRRKLKGRDSSKTKLLPCTHHDTKLVVQLLILHNDETHRAPLPDLDVLKSAQVSVLRERFD